MKKSQLFLIVITLLLFGFSCQKNSNPFQSNPDDVSGEMAKKPVKDTEPEIEELYIEGWDSDKTIPRDDVIVKYKVINAKNVDYITIAFRYDHDGDDEYRLFFDPYIFHEMIPGNGEDQIIGEFPWNGRADPDFSSTGYVFDQLATESDQYLLRFSVSGQNMWVYNGQPAEDERVRIIADPAPEGPFWVTSVSATPQPTSKKNKKYAAELIATVTCSQNGFKGSGQWIQVDPVTGEKVPMKYYNGCPNGLLNDDDGQTGASPNCQLFVGPGTYRFYVRNVYHPDYSYYPSQNFQGNWPEEPYAEVIVN